MKRYLSSPRRSIMTVVVLAAAMTLAACSTTPEPGAGDESVSIAFVSPQKAGDSGPIDDMIAALDRLKSDYDATTKYVELSDPSTYESTLRNLAQAGTDYVVTAFPGMQQPLQAVAPEFPDTNFLLIFGDKFDPELPNARSVSYDVYQAMYVSGIAAANATTSGKIGYIGGAPQPPLNANYHAFSDGAKSVDPSITVIGAFVGSFDDAAKGRDVAASMIAEGVDVIQTDAAAASLGVITAGQTSGILVIADSSGEVAAQYPETVVGTTFLKFGDSLYQQISTALDGSFESGYVTSGLADGIVGLNLSDAFLNGTSPKAAAIKGIVDQLTKAVEDVSSGAVTVTFDPSGI
ncbi:MAG: BMP family ABC transporter substrate-binding protein [Cryobacterium sp.]|nr:BMP family ABC transporter substrate-binding protein [Cryobacterium sp.]